MVDKEKIESQKTSFDSSATYTQSTRDSGQKNSSDQSPPVKDFWDKLAILLRPTMAILTAIIVLIVGEFGKAALEERNRHETELNKQNQKEITRRAEISQNYRLYTELLSKREEAESGLRKDMFSTILKEFFRRNESDSGTVNIKKRLLKLEMLALNFGEALSLSPLFVELDKDIEDSTYSPESEDQDRKNDRNRLQSLAKRVSQQQLSALSTGGKLEDFTISIEDLMKSDSNNPVRKVFDIELDGIIRKYTFSFFHATEEDKSIKVEVNIYILNNTDDLEIESEKPVEKGFELNYYNFPMVDNTRLSSDQRFALIMTDYKKLSVDFSAIVFPGKYSSLRDKPFLDDIIHRLQLQTKAYTPQ